MIFILLHALDITFGEKKPNTETWKPDNPVRETSSLQQPFSSLIQPS